MTDFSYEYCIENDLVRQHEIAAIAKEQERTCCLKEENLKEEIIETLQLLYAYSYLSIVKNVRYPNGTHEEALKRAVKLIDKLKG